MCDVLLDMVGKLTVPPLYHDKAQDVVQVLVLGDVRQRQLSPASTMFATTGRQLYVIGDIDGGFRPRSNPYDLYNFGQPLPNDPLANKLQGVWAQPVKALNGYGFVVEAAGEAWPLLAAEQFTQTFREVRFDYRRDTLIATRQDFVPQDRPALFTALTLRNTARRPVDVHLVFFVYFDLEDARFTSLANRRNWGETVTVNDGRLIARATSAPEAWAVAIGGAMPPSQTRVTNGPDGHHIGQLAYTARLEAGTEQAWVFGVVVESKSGPQVALQHLDGWLPQHEALLVEKRALYDRLLAAGPHFHSPDARFNAAFDLARANLQMLEAESPSLGCYFYAGLENFPFWFSNDGAYSVPGLLASNLIASTQNHLFIGQCLASQGHVPHQVSPSGKVVVKGHAQETPQWVLALWDVYRWTGDRSFLATTYPAVQEGLFDYTLGALDPDGDGYPAGPGIIERRDMGAEKLDSATYLWAALHALAQMADVLNDPATAARARAAAECIVTRFDVDWWDAAGGTYAMSLEAADNAQRPAPCWAVVVPLEVGLATPEHAAATFATLRTRYLNQWGLKHTAGADERVWTLSTATLSRAAYRYGEPELGFQMLQHIAQTLDHGSIGLFHELIPDGLCFLQLWSGATFVRGVVEDLMGVHVRADRHTVTIAPQLPAAWDCAELEHLRFGAHVISILATPSGIAVCHLSGPGPLAVTYRAPDGKETAFTLEPGKAHESGALP